MLQETNWLVSSRKRSERRQSTGAAGYRARYLIPYCLRSNGQEDSSPNGLAFHPTMNSRKYPRQRQCPPASDTSLTISRKERTCNTWADSHLHPSSSTSEQERRTSSRPSSPPATFPRE